MNSAHIILLLKAACWLVIGGFAVATFGMRRDFSQMSQPDSGLWCGNSVTEPLKPILSYGAPLAASAVALLAILWWRGLASLWSVVPEALLVIGCTASLLFLGIGFFQAALPGYHFSNLIWWVRPFGQFLGI